MRILPSIVAAFLLAAAAASPALAQANLSNTDPAAYLHEFRLGASFEGVQLDDTTYLPTIVPFDRLHKASFDVLFRSPFPDVFSWIGSPKPSVGATLSLSGETSWAYAGLTWQLPVFETPLFLEGTVGATIHDGALHSAPEGEPVYGCRMLLYTRATIGYDINEDWTASVNFEHGSHGRVCGTDNYGFNAVGFKLGYKF